MPIYLGVPGVTKFRAFRRIAGTREVLVILEFADQAAWASWRSNEKVHKIINELRAYASGLNIELWQHVQTRRTVE